MFVRRAFIYFLFYAVGFLSLATPASAQNGAPQTNQVPAPLNNAQRTNVAIDLRPALTAARQAMQEGDFEKAERLYLIILKVLPNMTDVRLEYAAAARHAGKARRAREILIPLDVDALPPGMRSAYRNIQWGEHAFDVSFSPRIMFDSNLNSGPRKDTITIGGLVFSLDDESLPTDSTGLGGTLAMQGVWMPEPDVGLGATAIADGDFYEDSDFNNINLSLSAGPRFIIMSSLLRLNALGGTRFLGGDRLEDHYGGQAALTFNIAPATPFTVSASHREYRGSGSNNTSRDRNQSTLAVSVASDNILPWDGSLWVNAAAEREDWQRDIEDNTSYRGGFGISLPKHKYVESHVMFNATRRLYDNTIPVLGVKRAEWRLEPSIRVDLKNLGLPIGDPYVQYTYIDNRSNVSLTDYDQHKLTGGVTLKAW